jgi:hypothetical protein
MRTGTHIACAIVTAGYGIGLAIVFLFAFTANIHAPDWFFTANLGFAMRLT